MLVATTKQNITNCVSEAPNVIVSTAETVIFEKRLLLLKLEAVADYKLRNIPLKRETFGGLSQICPKMFRNHKFLRNAEK